VPVGERRQRFSSEEFLLLLDAYVSVEAFEYGTGGYLGELFRLYLVKASAVDPAFRKRLCWCDSS